MGALMAVGSTAQFTCIFRDINKAAADPTTIVLKVLDPSGAEITKAKSDFTKTSTGIYYYLYTTSVVGVHHVSITAAIGATTKVMEDEFETETSYTEDLPPPYVGGVFKLGFYQGYTGQEVDPIYYPSPGWTGYKYDAYAFVDLPAATAGSYWSTALHILQQADYSSESAGNNAIFIENNASAGHCGALAISQYCEGESIYVALRHDDNCNGMEVASWGYSTLGILISYQNRLLAIEAPDSIENAFYSSSVTVLKPWNTPSGLGEFFCEAPGRHFVARQVDGTVAETDWCNILRTRDGSVRTITAASNTTPIYITVSAPVYADISAANATTPVRLVCPYNHNFVDGWEYYIYGVGIVPDGNYLITVASSDSFTLSVYTTPANRTVSGRHPVSAVAPTGSFTAGGTATEIMPYMTEWQVTIKGCTGNTAANGTFYITKTGNWTFTIPATGNGAYTGSGIVTGPDIESFALKDYNYQPRWQIMNSGEQRMTARPCSYINQYYSSPFLYIGGTVWNSLYSIPAYWRQFVDITSVLKVNNDYLGTEYAPDMKWRLQMPIGGGYFGGWADVLTVDQFRTVKVFGSLQLGSALQSHADASITGYVTVLDSNGATVKLATIT